MANKAKISVESKHGKSDIFAQEKLDEWISVATFHGLSLIWIPLSFFGGDRSGQ